MFIKCPECRAVSQLHRVVDRPRLSSNFCTACQRVVQIDLLRDEVNYTSSTDSVEKAERKKILVVDDDATIRKIAGELLTNAGYDVLKAADGQQALDMALKEHPDLIVLDLVMPKMTGFTVVREIRQDPRIKNIPILIFSEVISVQAAHDILHKYGVSCFMSKAQMMISLVSRVREILSKQADQVA